MKFNIGDKVFLKPELDYIFQNLDYFILEPLKIIGKVVARYTKEENEETKYLYDIFIYETKERKYLVEENMLYSYEEGWDLITQKFNEFHNNIDNKINIWN